MNYIGNKYKLLGQIIPLLPPARRFVDLFAGGLDVSINFGAEFTICNDINYHLIEIYRAFQTVQYNELIAYLDERIAEYSLSKINKDGYIRFRDYYNQSGRNPLDLYLLMNFGFNYQLRFNSNHEFNNPFGKDRSSFNSSIRRRLEIFVERIKEFQFCSCDFRSFNYSVLQPGDLIYCDPPYTISTGSYNDGKRGFNGWSEADDIALIHILDLLSDRGVHFALSSVLEHKGMTNQFLLDWAQKYTIHELTYNYNNCNYQANNLLYHTREVLITNG